MEAKISAELFDHIYIEHKHCEFIITSFLGIINFRIIQRNAHNSFVMPGVRSNSFALLQVPQSARMIR
jgi:hypothetical protein